MRSTQAPEPQNAPELSAENDWATSGALPPRLAGIGVLDTITQGYEQNAFEKDQGDQVDGMREALYFRR